MNIVEHLIERFLILPGEAEQLSRTTPPKPIRPPTQREANGRGGRRTRQNKGARGGR
jgi:hypothetical protein